MTKHPECFKPWCGVDGKKCVDCASYNPPEPFVQPAVEAVSDRLRAKVVRQALDECSKLAFNTSIERARLWHALAVDATDEELNKLRLLLK